MTSTAKDPVEESLMILCFSVLHIQIQSQIRRKEEELVVRIENKYKQKTINSKRLVAKPIQATIRGKLSTAN